MEVGLSAVALRAGVSPATASNALSGARHVAEGTRRRVFEVAEELNYHPNLVARSLRRQETKTLALLVADIANPYYPAIARAVHDRVDLKGYVSFIGNTDGDPEAELRVLQQMRSRGVDGVIMGTMALTPEKIRGVLGPVMPLVLLNGESLASADNAPRHFRADEVGTDDSIGIGEAVSYLQGKGVRDIGFISGPVDSLPGTGRLASFESAMAVAGMALNDEWVEHAGAYTLDAGFEAAQRLLAGNRRPAAIMCANDLIALGVLEAARDHDLEVPTDLAVIGFDDIPTAKLVTPRLTTIINPATLVGYACADALMRRMEHPDLPFEHVALPTHLVVRASA